MRIVPLLLLAGAVASCERTERSKNPTELGQVRWQRDYEAGRKEARATGKDLLLFFQEVPGWGNCTRFGTQVLGHPLLVDAIEENFVPVCIYNNAKGQDAAVLKAFKERAWNNPVVRIVDVDGKDIVERNGRGWTVGAVARQLVTALAARKKPVPPYLRLLDAAHRPRQQKAVFGMPWYWVGEVEFGLLPGVLATFPGWIGRAEVVEVTFDPKVISYEALVREAVARKCSSPVFTRSEAQQKIARAIVGDRARRSDGAIRGVKDNKYHLGRSVYRHLPLSKAQAARINANPRDGERWLSPRQKVMLAKVRGQKNARRLDLLHVELRRAWKLAER